MKVKRQICIAHFRGSDGKGTCNDLCQWYHPEVECPNGKKVIVSDNDLTKKYPFINRISGTSGKRRANNV